MRAEEMTVGIELCDLENLRIFNGYDVGKKERQTSNPSSPEESACGTGGESPRSKTKGHHSLRQRCGRPSNPVPRHKRDSHIRAEYKRRDKIQKGFDTLQSLVPELGNVTSGKESKSSMLYKAAEYCRGLKAECGQSQNEAAALRQELETLGSEIHRLQSQLPDHGVKETPEPTQDLDLLYNEYVREQTRKNWKFWIFSFFISPLYKSYRSMISGKMNQFEFAQATNEWVTESLSLANLRKGFLDTFRKFSTQTSILLDPSKLEMEAYAAVEKLGTSAFKQSPPSPNQEVASVSTSPIPYSPASGSFTPTMVSPSLIPNLDMISPSLETMVVKGKEPMSPPATTDVPRSGRSRSSTPPSDVANQRRRSRSRSEINRQKFAEKSQPMEITDEQPGCGIVTSNPGNSTLHTGSGAQILRMILTGDKMPEVSDQRYGVASGNSIALGGIDVVSGSNNSSTTTSTFDLDTFVSSCSSPSSMMSTEAWPQGSVTTQPGLIASAEPVTVFTTSCDALQSSAFLPLDSSVSISNGQITPLNQSLVHNETGSLLSDISFIMDMTQNQPSDSYDLDNLSVFTTAQPTVISHHSPLSASHNTCSFFPSSDEPKPVKQEVYNHDEDSLTGMLNIDIMDVSLLSTFLDQDHVPVTSNQNQSISSS